MQFGMQTDGWAAASGQLLMHQRAAHGGTCPADLRLEGVEGHVAIQQKICRHVAGDPHCQLRPAWLHAQHHQMSNISCPMPPAVSL